MIATYTGGAVAQSVERATPGEEVLGSIPAVVAHSLLVGSVSVLCDRLTRLRQKSWSPRSVSCVPARKIVRRQSWDEDVKKLTNQPNKATYITYVMRTVCYSGRQQRAILRAVSVESSQQHYQE